MAKARRDEIVRLHQLADELRGDLEKVQEARKAAAAEMLVREPYQRQFFARKETGGIWAWDTKEAKLPGGGIIITAGRKKVSFGTALSAGGAELGEAFLAGVKEGAANEVVRTVFAGFRRLGMWHSAFDDPRLAPLLEAALPLALASLAASLDGQVPHAGDAAHVLMLAAREPARRLGSDGAHLLGSLFRNIALAAPEAGGSLPVPPTVAALPAPGPVVDVTPAGAGTGMGVEVACEPAP